MFTCIVKFRNGKFTKYRNVKKTSNLANYFIKNNKPFFFITVYDAKTRNKLYLIKQNNINNWSILYK